MIDGGRSRKGYNLMLIEFVYGTFRAKLTFCGSQEPRDRGECDRSGIRREC